MNTLEHLEALAAANNDRMQLPVGHLREDAWDKFEQLTRDIDFAAIAQQVRKMREVCEAAKAIARGGRWLPMGADNFDYVSHVAGVVGTDWNSLVATLAALEGAGHEQ